MQIGIWKSKEDHIHIVHHGVELVFEDIYDFMDAMETWHEYALFHELEKADTSEGMWRVYGKANRN